MITEEQWKELIEEEEIREYISHLRVYFRACHELTKVRERINPKVVQEIPLWPIGTKYFDEFYKLDPDIWEKYKDKHNEYQRNKNE